LGEVRCEVCSVSPFIGGIAPPDSRATELPAKKEAAALAAQEKRDAAKAATVQHERDKELANIEWERRQALRQRTANWKGKGSYRRRRTGESGCGGSHCAGSSHEGWSVVK
jgi:hypothetical protein